MSDKPTIDVGPVIQQQGWLPSWVRTIFALLRGLVIHAGPVDVQLDQGQGIPPARSGLDKPAEFKPPKMGRR